MAELSGLSAAGAMRQAEAVLRTTGGRMVLLRLPGLAASGDDAEQLGLATPAFRDVLFGPAVFQKAGSTKTLLVSASAVQQQTQSLAFDAAEALFASAVGLVIEDELYVIVKSEAAQAGGTAFCYRLTLQPPAR